MNTHSTIGGIVVFKVLSGSYEEFYLLGYNAV
jgi:hypothetical protein